jgi:uncharacterized protein (DUF58 family)
VLASVRRWLNHDYLPSLRPYLQWMRRPLPWLVLAATAALLFGLTTQSNALWLSAGIVSTVLLGLLWPWLALRGVACRLTFSLPRTTEGESVAAALTLTNRWPWPLWGLAVVGGFRPPIDDGDEDDTRHVETALASVPAWSESAFRWDFTPSRRGLYPRATSYIVTGFPFGLWQARRMVTVDAQLIAWPRRHAVPEDLPDAGSDLNGLGLADARQGDAGDIVGVRPYRNGDMLRRVHWPQTARHNRLIVCERQAATRPSVRLIADLRGDTANGTDGSDTLERVIRTTASLCQSLHQRHVRIEYCDADASIRPAPDQHGLEQLLDRLATIPESGLASELPVTELPLHSTLCSQGMLEVVVTGDGIPPHRPHYRSARMSVRRRIVANTVSDVQDQWRAICRET